MHRTMLGGLVLAVSMLIAAPTVAMAATPSSTQQQVAAAQQVGPITVPLIGNNGTNAVATITSMSVVNGVLTAAGTVTGQVTTLVAGIPVTTTVTNAPFTAPITILQQAGTCRVLDLVLGPIHLDLLGLVVDLNQVNLDITAVPGPGNLLGNLLCAVAHLLDGGNTGGLTGLLNLLNSILGG